MPSSSIFSSAELFVLFPDLDCFRFVLVFVALRGLVFLAGRANGACAKQRPIEVLIPPSSQCGSKFLRDDHENWLGLFARRVNLAKVGCLSS